MNTLTVLTTRWRYRELFKLTLLVALLYAVWRILNSTSWNADLTMGYVDPSIWVLVLISLICFIVMIGLSAWIMLRLWNFVGLPAPQKIISQFNYLESCQKLTFLLAAYSLLLFAGVGCLMAIC